MSVSNTDDLHETKDNAGQVIVAAGSAVGTAAGGSIVAAGAANVSAAATATALSASAASTFSAFGATATVTNPATWAILATNPVGATVLVAGGCAAGALGAYKLAKKFLN